MEMPTRCKRCDLEYYDDDGHTVCAATNLFTDNNRYNSRRSDCPLHPLDDDKICVGDEVCFEDGETFKAVVLDESVVNGSWCVLTENGCFSVFDEKKLHRTGRHFDEVETMLKKMRGKS